MDFGESGMKTNNWSWEALIEGHRESRGCAWNGQCTV